MLAAGQTQAATTRNEAAEENPVSCP